MSVDMLKDYMEYRCGMYYWLKNLYMSEPTVDILSEISNTCKEYAMDSELPEHEKAFTEFFKALNQEQLVPLYKEIKAEYARLFIGPRRVPVPPYESVYRENKKSIFGRNTMIVRELYRNAGIELGTGLNVPDDFIGYELEFMYYLTFETIKAIEKNDVEKISKLLSYQHYFLAQHLTKWINEFTQDITKETTLDYFKRTALFTQEFINDDFTNLSELTA